MKTKLIFSALAIFALAIFAANTTFAQTKKINTNQTDLQFLDMMLQHHADGVKMAQTGVEKAQNAGVKSLAQKIADGQQKDIAEMQAMRDRNFSGQPQAESMMMKEQTMTMEQMMQMSQSDMQKLEAAAGAEFDRTFLDVFTKHHQMALDMSKEETSKGKFAEAKKKSREIISVQTKELAEIKRLKAQVGGAAAKKKSVTKKKSGK